ncbi:hypothetical protein E4T42_03053 [Aureobasidium subglaciale]|nr:hypothetical protein E4T42_03053 [Aureobasidium subglaciale]
MSSPPEDSPPKLSALRGTQRNSELALDPSRNLTYTPSPVETTFQRPRSSSEGVLEPFFDDSPPGAVVTTSPDAYSLAQATCLVDPAQTTTPIATGIINRCNTATSPGKPASVLLKQSDNPTSLVKHGSRHLKDGMQNMSTASEQTTSALVTLRLR